MIAEDELMARKELTYLLANEEDVYLCPSVNAGDALVEAYREHEPDVVFLDVEMPGMTGVEAAKEIMEIAQPHPPLFVFTTAYDMYALDAFEVDAVDYLLKPYDEKRFMRTLNRVRERLKQRADDIVAETKQLNLQTTDKLLIDDGERMIVLDPEKIYYAATNNRRIDIFTKDREISCRLNLQELEDRLKGYSFFRTHRSFLVNLNHIKEITPWFNGTSNVKLDDGAGTQIPVSRSARKLLLDRFNF